jgi:hypothetical protein
MGVTRPAIGYPQALVDRDPDGPGGPGGPGGPDDLPMYLLHVV